MYIIICVTGLGYLYLEGLIHGGVYFRNFTVTYLTFPFIFLLRKWLWNKKIEKRAKNGDEDAWREVLAITDFIPLVSIWYSLMVGYRMPDYNPAQNLLTQIAKMPIFYNRPGKNWNLRQMNARFPPSPYPKLFRIAWQLYTLVFRLRLLWIGGPGKGAYFFYLEETGVGSNR